MDAILSLKNLLADAMVGTDSTFKNFLITHKHRDDLIAPMTLRKILAQFAIIRVEFGFAYAIEEGQTTLTNWMGELGVRGRLEEVRETLNKAMHDFGFKPGKLDPHEEDTISFPHSQKGVIEEASFRGPHRWVGAKEPSCGFQVYWKIQSPDRIETPTLNDLLETLPLLRDSRVDDKAYLDLGPSRIHLLAVGGTWTKYYDWDVTLVPPDAGKMYQHLEDLLNSMEYIPGNVSEDFTTWERQKTGSFTSVTNLQIPLGLAFI